MMVFRIFAYLARQGGCLRLRPPEAESRLEVARRGFFAPAAGTNGLIEKTRPIRRSPAKGSNDKRLQSMADVDCNSGNHRAGLCASKITAATRA